MMKRAILSALSAYLILGALCALAFHFTMPAINWFGLAYMALAWGAFATCNHLEALGCGVDQLLPPELAQHLFTF